MNIVALAGGVGGARLADGLAQCLPLHPSPAPSPSPQNLTRESSSLTVIVNTGDDFDLWGMRVCPDLDTVMYTLAGVANRQTGWGIEGDTFETLEMLKRLGQDTWFRVGDRDLAIDLRRTLLLREGQRLTQVTELLCQSLGMKPNTRILPMSDTAVATLVETDEGTLAFQDYFVRRAWQPVIHHIRFQGIERARLSMQVQSALDHADLVVVCPSNPFVSIDPILSVADLRDQLRGQRAVAVSPIIGGQAVKGPAAKMFREMGQEPTALAVAQHYADWLDGFVIDHADATLREDIERLNIRVLVTHTLMRDRADRGRLAHETLEFARTVPA